MHGFESRTRCHTTRLHAEASVPLGNNFGRGFHRNPENSRKDQRKSKLLLNPAARKRSKGQENLEKEQQRATYWQRWKHIGMSQENVTGYGYPRGYRKMANAT